MKKTQFLGITTLDADDSIYDDNAAFISRDRLELDRAARIGAKIHRHDASVGLANPESAPSGTVIASAGAIAADQIISLGYTLQDAAQGETELSPVAVVSTPTPLDIPVIAPSATVDYSAGNLLTNSYYYAITHVDGAGGETPLGPAVVAEREPGFPNGRVILTQLNASMGEATGWRLYRSIGGGLYGLLATGSAAEGEFIDDGATAPDCSIHPPSEANTTNNVSSLVVALPSVPGDTAFINLYAAVDGDFSQASLLAQYPAASAGGEVLFDELDFLDSQPPDVNRSYGGAAKIDPDTEILDWHWKRPVADPGSLPAGEEGDVRLALSNQKLYGVFLPTASGPEDWEQISGASAASAGIDVTASGTTIDEATEIEFVGSGGITTSVSEPTADLAEVLIEGDRALLAQEGMGVVIHGAVASTPRPNNFKQYTWIGSVEPVNMAEYDIWIEA